MTIITDKYNKIDAKLYTSHNVMAKKRKMYLYKRSGSLQSKADAEVNGHESPTLPSSPSPITATSQQSQASTTLSSSTTTTITASTAATTTNVPSDLLSTTNCFRVRFLDNESLEVLQQQQLEQQQHYHHHHHHHHHSMSEDCELHPKALRICEKHLPPLHSKTSNEEPLLANHHPSCSCTNNCHSCRCSYCNRLPTGTTIIPETDIFGRPTPQTRFPFKTSYNLLSETDDTNIGKESNEAQKQTPHCTLTSKSTSRSKYSCGSCCYCCINHNNSTPSNIDCCCSCSGSPNYLTTSTNRTAAAALANNRNIEHLVNRSEVVVPSSLPCISLSTSFSSNNDNTTCYRDTDSSRTSSLMSLPGYRRRYLSQQLQTICMIFKMLLSLISTTLPHYPPRCSPFDTSSNINREKRQQQQPPPHHRYHHHRRHSGPQMEQRLMTHLNENRQRQQQQQQQHKMHQQQMSSSSHRRQQRHHLLPNVSYLNTILMGLSILSLFLFSSSQALATASIETSLESSLSSFPRSTDNSQALVESSESSSGQIRLNRRETVCRSLDIRNSPSQMRQLANCTVIEGFLLISLINGASFEEYNETYPLLTEVTDYIIVYQVYFLRSLGQIFPNLSVIRGRDLFEGYALLVYFNSHLEELGLPKLTTIRGGVRIEKNFMLCYVKTIDWSQIIETNGTDLIIENNRDTAECPSCHDDQWNDALSDPVCKKHSGQYCWNSQSCQKICPESCRHNCVDENTCCNEKCLGDCSADNVNECGICEGYSFNHTVCVDKCPPNFFVFLNRRCITAEECLRIGTIFVNNKPVTVVPFNGNCTETCPNGYYKVSTTCVACTGKCIKKCGGTLIDGAARAKEYVGCNYIEGSLTIVIKRASQIMADLEYGLSSIETISGFLKVQGTYGMFNLQFFKNLKSIKGEQLFENKYAFYVLENTDLEALWNPNQTVHIENGTVYFHFNPKLCLSEIHALLPMLRNQTHFDKNEVAEDSNGSKGSCNTSLLDVMIVRIKSFVVIVNITNPIKYDDERTFIGYQFLHMEDPYGNATKYGFRPCDDGWIVSEPSKDTSHIFQSLRPFTQYAFYVKTMTISTERRNAQSAIHHFTTKSDQPSFVYKIEGYANSSSEIAIKWVPPKEPNGKLIKYKIRATYEDRDHQLESRNYCKDPLRLPNKNDKAVPSTITEKPKVSQDCKCPKSPQGAVFTDESVDASIHASIELENALQNFVYVKKERNTNTNSSAASSAKSDANRSRRALDEAGPFDSFMLRHIREAPTSGEGVNDHRLALDHNETRMNPTGEYYEVITSSVNASTYDFVFSKLKHFSWYMLGIQACREPEENNNASACSVEVKIYVRTLKLDNVDKAENLRATLETTNSSRTNVRLFWQPPAKPNGAVVSYLIAYKLQAPDQFEEKKCITEVDYIELDYQNNGYVLSSLQSGNYSLRVRADTLAGEGNFSEPIFVVIPLNTLAPSTIVGITLGIIVLVLIAGGGVYFFIRKRFLSPPSDLKIFPSDNPHYISLQYIPDEWEVARERVIQLSPLGQGSFGMVYEGILKSSKDDTPCAIKTVNENATDRERMNFLNEACVMKQFDTYHVVRLLGVCSRGQPALVIMELMKNGDLKSYLRAHRPDERDDMGHLLNRAVSSQPPPLSRIYQMAIEIADGMAYLAAKKFVHRDLAARNCMVAADLTVKIGDFGMTRDIYENDYYRKGTKGLLPVRWMPPESLRDGVYSTASDVFSYGVVLWEMATLASQPYQGLANDQVLRYVIDGGVMERPENCPDKLYSLMQKCWHHRPAARPSFIEIIRYLFDLADPHFREVSFYNSEDGQHILANEVADRNQRSGDVFDYPENDMEDVTTPLRLEEYSNYKLNMDNNSSMGHRGDSSMVIDDDAPHSPYSMGSPMVVSSTPDEQSRGSYNMSRILHPHSHLLNSAPSTSAGLRKLGSSSTSHQLTHPHTHPHHRNLYQPTHTRFSQQHAGRQHRSEDIDTYVQPDFEPTDEGNKRDSDEQGYEIYDPSPNYSEHVPSANVVADDDEDDFGGHSTAGQNLLVRPKGRYKQPTIMPLSTSMPDDVIGQQAASSLHPSTASAASSNASSKAGTGKYPSLRAVADSARLRMMNMRIFNHKRSGSNASHKSTSSNPNSSTGVGGSINNLARSGRGKSMSGQNLGTIESGGSGSAGSYTGNPRFFSPSGTSTSDNPNYRRLDDNVGDNSSIGIRPRLQSASAYMMGSSQPNYKMLDESLNTTGASVHTGGNPNYEIMHPGGGPPPPQLSNEAGSSYVMMNEPSQKKVPEVVSALNIGDEANYQMMCPLLPASTTTAAAPPTTTAAQVTTPPTMTVLAPPPAAAVATAATTTQPPPHAADGERVNRFSSSSPSSADSISSCHESEDDDLHGTDDIKLERLPLSRRNSKDHSLKRQTKKDRSRSQSSSSGKSATNTASSSTIIPHTPATTSQQPTTTKSSAPSTTFSRKEKWFKEQQQPPQPPPNGFVGREA